MKQKNIHNILLTGGAGYIGAITARELQKQGFHTITLDNLSSGHKEHSTGRFYNVNLLEKEHLMKVFSIEKIDAVMHFAGLAIPSESMQKPGLYYTHNITTTVNLLDAMVAFHVPYIIFSSSCSVYGNLRHLPAKETDPFMPLSVYAATKAYIEQVLSFYEKTHGLLSVCLRYFNASGATFDGTLGEKHDPETHLLPNAITALLTKKPFYLYGDDYATPDGTCIRDFIHVVDVAQAHIQALSYLEKEKKNDIFNLATGKGNSIREIITAIESLTQQQLEVIRKPKRDGDPAAIYADSTKIQKILKWQPQFSDLSTIIQSALLWHKKQLLP